MLKILTGFGSRLGRHRSPKKDATRGEVLCLQSQGIQFAYILAIYNIFKKQCVEVVQCIVSCFLLWQRLKVTGIQPQLAFFKHFVTSLLLKIVKIKCSGVNPTKLCFSSFSDFCCSAWEFVVNTKKCVYYTMSKLSHKKQKNSYFLKKKKFGWIDSWILQQIFRWCGTLKEFLDILPSSTVTTARGSKQLPDTGSLWLTFAQVWPSTSTGTVKASYCNHWLLLSAA